MEAVHAISDMAKFCSDEEDYSDSVSGSDSDDDDAFSDASRGRKARKIGVLLFDVRVDATSSKKWV